ncbi:hypothetical protein DPMN_182019 [Dreissena polymorpha]|uniref:Uncharacterized protein n=1 Tax=Dreissena polymorpha TaxID=45954 RepID=A0A9D4DEQ7_DREPO|nr:hypothetical protein DPMN_182019 [Dreissena polymorpha]
MSEAQTIVVFMGYQVSSINSCPHRGIPSKKRKQSFTSRDSKSAATTIVVIAGYEVSSTN